MKLQDFYFGGSVISRFFPASSCGAKVKKKNARGQTAFDVAISSGCNSMVALLAAQTGLVLLDRLAKHN